MPRPPRADAAGGLYHALNRGNLRADIFKKEGDFDLPPLSLIPRDSFSYVRTKNVNGGGPSLVVLDSITFVICGVKLASD